MQRDMDLIRDLMVRLETVHPGYGSLMLPITSEALTFENRSLADVHGHLLLLVKAGFLEGGVPANGGLRLDGISWKGHDFLDTVRSPDVWEKTKIAVNKVGGFSLELVLDIGKAVLKQKASEVLGVSF